MLESTNSIRMLAHDVCKPFSMVNISLAILEKAENFEHFKKLSSDLKPYLINSFNNITEMLNDFMHTKFDNKTNKDKIDVKKIIDELFNQHIYCENLLKIGVEYNFYHIHELFYSKAKFYRILNNLISNAIEAMNGNGKIWVNTKNKVIDRKNYIEFTFGNSNSFIPKKYRKKIFELNYTSGKKNGNGIGLYSVKNLIEEAGGRVSCNASLKKGVEFIFTIPCFL